MERLYSFYPPLTIDSLKTQIICLNDSLEVCAKRLKSDFSPNLIPEILKDINHRLLSRLNYTPSEETSPETTPPEVEKNSDFLNEARKRGLRNIRRNFLPMLRESDKDDIELKYDFYECHTLKCIFQAEKASKIHESFSPYLKDRATKENNSKGYFLVLKAYVLDLVGSPPLSLLCLRNAFEDDLSTLQLMEMNFRRILQIDRKEKSSLLQNLGNLRSSLEKLSSEASKELRDKFEEKITSLQEKIEEKETHISEDTEVWTAYKSFVKTLEHNLRVTAELKSLQEEAEKVLVKFDKGHIKRGHYSETKRQEEEAREAAQRAQEKRAKEGKRKEEQKARRDARLAEEAQRATENAQKKALEVPKKEEAIAVKGEVSMPEEKTIIPESNLVSLAPLPQEEVAFEERIPDPYADTDPEVRAEILDALAEIQRYNQVARMPAAAAEPAPVELQKILLPQRQLDMLESFWTRPACLFRDVSYIFKNILGATLENSWGSVRIFKFPNTPYRHTIHEPHPHPDLGPRTLARARAFLLEKLGLSLDSFALRKI